MYMVDDRGNLAGVSTSTKYKTVLKVRQIQERKSQTELHQLRVAHAEEEATLIEIKETHQSALSDAVRQMRIKATEAQTSRAFIGQLSREIDKQTEKVEQIQSLEQNKRAELVERAKSTAMIEKLDKKMQDEETKEIERKEQRLMDVLAQRIRTEVA